MHQAIASLNFPIAFDYLESIALTLRSRSSALRMASAALLQCDFFAMLMGQNAIEQGGFVCP
jgi:hypothetical protein